MKFSSPFRSVLRTGTMFVVLSSVLWLTSCDDDPEPDKVSPELTVNNLADNATVWDVVNIALDVTDDRGIDKVEVFVDGSLVTTLTAAPFSTEWDTNGLTDGSHVVKIVATDKGGNATEKEISVTVKNVLVSFNVPAGYLWTDGNTRYSRGFIFLSDADGKLLKSVELQNGQSVEIKVPGFKGETFYLTQASVTIDGTENYPYLWTYAQVERGKWTLMGDVSDDVESIGQAKLIYSNALADARYILSSPDGYEAYAEAGTVSSTIPLSKTPSSLYATRFSFAENGLPTPAYRVFTNIVVGNNNINLGLVNTPLTKLTATIPAGFDYAGVDLSGTMVANDFTESYWLGGFYLDAQASSTLTYYKPGTTFATYFAEISLESDKYALSRGTRNADQINFALPQYQGDVVFSNNKIISSVAGSFDFVSTSYEDSQDDAEWHFIFPSGANVSLAVPAIPDALKSFNIPAINANPADFWLYEFENVDGYSGFKTFIRNSTYGPDELYQEGKEYTELLVDKDITTGRAKKRTGKRESAVRKKFAIGK